MLYIYNFVLGQFPSMFPVRRLSLVLLFSLLNGCGGSSNSSSSGAPTPAPPPQVPDTILLAMQGGDPRGLQAADRDTLLQRAIALTSQIKTRQAATIANIYGDGSGLSLALNLGTNSSRITPRSKQQALPLIVSDSGAGLAAVAEIGKGRALAYGADVPAWMAKQTTEQQHYGLFARAMTWLLTGNANTPAPASVKFIATGYSAANISAVLQRMGKTGVALQCDLSLENTCWKDAELLVFGAGTTNSAGLQARVRDYIKQGKAVLYAHPSWVESAGGRSVLHAMGMELGDYPGNYFKGSADVAAGSDRTLAQSLAGADQMGALEASLRMLADEALASIVKTSPGPLDAIDRVHNDLASFQSGGVDVFKEEGTDLYALLVLWADAWRPSIDYAAVNKSTRPIDFLRTYASDSFLSFNRTYTTTTPFGQGDYMPVQAQSLAVSSEWETLDIALPQAGGTTAIGRGAVPAKGVQIEVLQAPVGVSLSIQTSYLRAWGDARKEYLRPRRPHSFRIPLPATGAQDFVSPSGGPLYLVYSGAAPGAVVKLRLRGTTRYAHFDFTGTPAAADISDAVAALKRKDFGWQTAKMVGGEIQQTIGMANSVIGNTDPQAYVVTRLKGILFDTNHMANGYSNIATPARVQAICDQLSWTCGGALHKAPNVQHFVGWIATCGFLCSGNPSDGYAGIDLGWGWAHELGHNTVQRVMHMEFNGVGCVVECDNNILAATQQMRTYAVLNQDMSGDRVDYPGLYRHIVANRALALGAEAQRADMEKRLWGGGDAAKLAVHFQLGYLFGKYRYGLAQPTSDATIDFMTLLTKGDRLVAKDWSVATAGKYGMARYATNQISNHDLLFVLSSTIIGRDLRKVFAMYGLPLSQGALDSVADLALPLAPTSYYALASGKANQLASGKWVELEGATPAYPF
jgi:hypothetical protein